MKNDLYLGTNIAIVNLNEETVLSEQVLVSSDGFRKFLERFLEDLAATNTKMFKYIASGREMNEMVDSLVLLTKELLVFSVDEVAKNYHAGLDVRKALWIVENGYNYWRSKQRFSVVSSTNTPVSFSTFQYLDSRYNQLVLSIYRTCEEKLQGKTNVVYRQLQAGTNASCVTKNYKWEIPGQYSVLKGIPFINKVMLRTPIIFHPVSNVRKGAFEEVFENPVKNFKFNRNDWYCMPLKVNDLLCFTYFHKNYMANGLAVANLFEVASEEEVTSRKPDLICLYGNQDEKDQTVFYYDKENDIWVSSISAFNLMDYFGYIKKQILTVHNLAKMTKGALPIHGSMMIIYFKDGRTKSLILMGDSGAGKSETIEAVKHLSISDSGRNKVERIDVVFDDMGSLKIVDGHVYANGTETGAFVRLDDLDKSTAYADLERSIFLNPESSNSRVIHPCSTYQMISANHKVDMILYANNYTEKTGVERFDKYEDAKEVFLQGKRMALGTTHEKGLSSTFFANPFGPMQRQELCLEIMDKVFEQLYKDDVFVGQIFTNLGTEHKDDIVYSAAKLLDLLKEI